MRDDGIPKSGRGPARSTLAGFEEDGMKRVLVALCFASLVCARADAELKYTMRTEVQKSEAPAKPAPNPLLAMMADGMTKQLLPEGGATMTYILGDKGVRLELANAAMGQAAGTITLAQLDGTAVVMNPKDQTYWKMPLKGAATAMQAAGMTPEVTLKPTGELETVAGVQCARSTFTMKMNLPIPESAKASLGPNFPSSLDMDGDTCATTDQFQKYGEIASKTQVTGMLAAMGLDQLMPGGIVLRQTIRLGGVDIRSVVTEIAEAEAPAGTFEIPAGYKEVPPPAAPH
jgi:hypothetical protein